MWRKLPKNFGTTGRQGNVKSMRVMDKLDKEACAEGDAIMAFRVEFGGKKPVPIEDTSDGEEDDE
jgi:hypothetical protein